MNILSIAPQPFFQPRGTPFSEYYRAKAMIELGHRVDILTYAIGEDVDLPGLTIHRTWPVPGIRSVRIGPSLAKLPLDAMIGFSAFRRMLSERYDLLDCHEEAGLLGVVLSKLFRVPTLYDMHSSLPEQLSNFQIPGARWLSGLFHLAERLTVRGSDAVIVICPYLRDLVAEMDRERPCFLIENSPLAESAQVAEDAAMALRSELALADSKVVLYTGTFEPYQGLELLYDAFAIAAPKDESLKLVLVGGHPQQVDAARSALEARGMEKRAVLTGQRPPEEMPAFLSAADVLVSPRSRGKNTPLKIYSYLRASKPIVATRLLTHTQVLDDEVAMLTAPDPPSFAEGILRLARDTTLSAKLSQAALARAESEYSYGRYLERTRTVLDFFSEKRQSSSISVSSEPATRN